MIPSRRFSEEMVVDFQEARLFARFADERRCRVDERDARVSASYPLARPKVPASARRAKPLKILERAKGFEPSTPTLARSCSCKILAG